MNRKRFFYFLLIFLYGIQSVAYYEQTEEPKHSLLNSKAYENYHFPIGAVSGKRVKADQSQYCVGFFAGSFFLTLKSCVQSLVTDASVQLLVFPTLQVSWEKNIEPVYEIKRIYYESSRKIKISDEELAILELHSFPEALNIGGEVVADFDPSRFRGQYKILTSRADSSDVFIEYCEKFVKNHGIFWSDCFDSKLLNIGLYPWIDKRGNLVGIGNSSVTIESRKNDYFLPIEESLQDLLVNGKTNYRFVRQNLEKHFKKTRGVYVDLKCARRGGIEMFMAMNDSSFVRSFELGPGRTHLMQIEEGDVVYLKARLKESPNYFWGQGSNFDSDSSFYRVDPFAQGVADFVWSLSCSN